MKNRRKGIPVTIHKSLTHCIMFGGVPQNVAIFNFGIGASLGFGGGAYYIIPICIMAHIAFAYAHRADEQCFACLRKYINLSEYYTT